ncbi:MAG: DNA polymerase III subunit delta [Leptospirales bacterium]
MKTEDFFEFTEALKAAKTAPHVIIVRVTDPEKAEKIHSIYFEKLSKADQEIDDIRLQGGESEPGTFHAELSTIPMFDTTRLLWVRHADTLLEKIAKNPTIKGYFQRDLENFPESTYLFLHLDNKKTPKAFDFLMKSAWVLEEKPLRERDLPGFIKATVRQMDFQIEEQAVQELSRKYSMNTDRLSDALNRLFTYTIHEKKIFVKDVRDICFDVEGDAIFTILDFIAEKKINRAIEVLINHKVSDGALFLTMLSRLFINSFRSRYLKECEKGLIEVHERLGLNTKHQYVMRMNEERMKKVQLNYSGVSTPRILGKFVELDKQLKENTLPGMQKNLLIMFVASLEHVRSR